jgi:hypothetical protein
VENGLEAERTNKMKTIQDILNRLGMFKVELQHQRDVVDEITKQFSGSNQGHLQGLLKFLDACLETVSDNERLKCPECGKDSVLDCNLNNMLLYCVSCKTSRTKDK